MKEGAEPVLVGQDLPPQTRIVYTAPDLAHRSPRTLSPPERKLARYINIILPKNTDPQGYLQSIRGWTCVEDVWPSPEVSLP